MVAAQAPEGRDRHNPDNPLWRARGYTPDGRRRRHWTKPERKYRLSYRRSPIATLVCTIAVFMGTSAAAYGTTRVGSIYSDDAFAGSGWATCSTPISWTTDTSNLSPTLAARIRPELGAAFAAWSRGPGYSFVDAGELPVAYNDAVSSVSMSTDIKRNIAVYFVPDAKSTMITNDVVGFGSPNKVLAATKEIVGGYAVLSADYIKVVDSAHHQALFTHELGHALGLTDSDDPENVMYRHLDTNSTLANGDIAGIKAIEKICTA